MDKFLNIRSLSNFHHFFPKLPLASFPTSQDPTKLNLRGLCQIHRCRWYKYQKFYQVCLNYQNKIYPTSFTPKSFVLIIIYTISLFSLQLTITFRKYSKFDRRRRRKRWRHSIKCAWKAIQICNNQDPTHCLANRQAIRHTSLISVQIPLYSSLSFTFIVEIDYSVLLYFDLCWDRFKDFSCEYHFHAI